MGKSACKMPLLLYCRGTLLCCCGLSRGIATGDYATDQRLGIGYWLLRRSMVSIVSLIRPLDGGI